MRTALGVVGALLAWFAVAFVAPAVVALAAGEPSWPFLVTGLAVAVTGLALKRLTGRRPPLDIREGFLVVVAVWLLVPAFGEVGPFGSYAPLGHLSKAILTALMFLGRIEIVPLAVLLRRSYWRA
ncbi:hypothetical protein [Streptomyces sp. NPDC050388]|uniref:hypothetical protein n=1 Tax=Streptomyces sp. NPDC050388 TaxID=3155781 RepID=UPI0034351066